MSENQATSPMTIFPINLSLTEGQTKEVAGTTLVITYQSTDYRIGPGYSGGRRSDIRTASLAISARPGQNVWG